MACRGVHFALTEEESKQLLKEAETGKAIDFIQEVVEARWETDWPQETDKSWDAIHRCLTDGTLKCAGKSALEKCVLGGRQLHRCNYCIVSFLTSDETDEVATALAGVVKEWFEMRYWALKKKMLWFAVSDYAGSISEEDLEYSWSYFQELKAFFQKAAAAKRAVVFTVDR